MVSVERARRTGLRCLRVIGRPSCSLLLQLQPLTDFLRQPSE